MVTLNRGSLNGPEVFKPDKEFQRKTGMKHKDNQLVAA